MNTELLKMLIRDKVDGKYVHTQYFLIKKLRFSSKRVTYWVMKLRSPEKYIHYKKQIKEKYHGHVK